MSSQSAQCTAALVRPRSLDQAADSESAAVGQEQEANLEESGREPEFPAPVPLPAYLQQTYWWAYLHPMAVRCCASHTRMTPHRDGLSRVPVDVSHALGRATEGLDNFPPPWAAPPP